MAEEESSVAPVVAEANGEAASIKKEAAVKKERVKPLPRPDRAAFDEQVGALQAQARAAPQCQQCPGRLPLRAPRGAGLSRARCAGGGAP